VWSSFFGLSAFAVARVFTVRSHLQHSAAVVRLARHHCRRALN
jgi:hypothetical protein